MKLITYSPDARALSRILDTVIVSAEALWVTGFTNSRETCNGIFALLQDVEANSAMAVKANSAMPMDVVHGIGIDGELLDGDDDDDI